MKINNFNKFGGTELRTSNPMKDYYAILGWIHENLSKQDSQSNKFFDWDMEFKKYVEIEKIYEYKNNSVIQKRFNFIVGHLVKWGFLEKDKEKTFKLNIDLDKFWNEKFFIEELFFKKMYLNWNEFRSMIDFIVNTENEEINIERFLWAFSVFDKKEDNFSDIYNKNKEDILNEISERSNVEELKNIYRKPPNEYKLFKKIYESFQKGKLLNQEEFNKIISKDFKFKYTKKLLNISKNIKNINYLDLINKYIKESNAKTFLTDLKKLSVIANIEKEYKDMFIRWMNQLYLLPRSKQEQIRKAEALKYINLDNLKKLSEENIYQIKVYNFENQNICQLPFDEEQVKNALINIQKNNFDQIKKEHKELQNNNNSTLAEYFVNLFFAHKLNLSNNEFKESCHTILNTNLLPSYTAGGGLPDFNWYNEKENIQYVVETTIHRTKNEIIKQESYSIVNHTRKVTQENTEKIKLFFINFLDFTKDEFEDDVDKVFGAIFDVLLTKWPNKNLIKLNFEDLTKQWNNTQN
ncbi:hypothetical protein [Metamycoplasma equirhinis]|uniref:hypothetical protein n=1 Tax=Metamycoplasma equirhinis TaxID=92402 RepID=UPI0035946F6A